MRIRQQPFKRVFSSQVRASNVAKPNRKKVAAVSAFERSLLSWAYNSMDRVKQSTAREQEAEESSLQLKGLQVAEVPASLLQMK